ncbi:hypothetical protein NI389_07465 [Pseudoalteromonas xiamenensis]|uniref:hypothetical protein n=1 Tax=Pseudoalteromonas xiamenensis TaxID=882626 RepID=UPI0027E44882|nr:hypothetical protein [Pseudoalteromonas xiamenensis]WMN61211.1 hypothetical protein NI389_07465 [Pseudoalteromonas xiamenensis]
MERELSLNMLLGEGFKNRIANFLTYYFEQPFKLVDDKLVATEQTSLICVVSKKNTVVTRKTYQSVSRSEIRTIVNLQKKSSSKLTHFNIIAKLDDEFEVVKTEFRIDEQYQRQFGFLIAEDSLLSNTYSDTAMSIDTPGGRLFIFGESGKSAYRGGLLNSIEQFGHSIGAIGKKNLEVGIHQFAPLLVSSINEVNLTKLFNQVHSYLNVGKLSRIAHMFIWAPLLSYTVGLCLVSSVTYLMLGRLEAQVLENGDVASNVLKQKVELDLINQLSRKVNGIAQQNRDVYPHWSLLAIALEHGALMNYFRYDNGVMKIDGAIENANELIAKFNASPLVGSAVFDGAVRKSNNLDNFSIQITFKENELAK